MFFFYYLCQMLTEQKKFIVLQRLGKKLLHHIVYDCIFAMSLYDQGLDKISYSHGTLSLHFCLLFVNVPISNVCPSPLLSLDPKIVEEGTFYRLNVVGTKTSFPTITFGWCGKICFSAV